MRTRTTLLAELKQECRRTWGAGDIDDESRRPSSAIIQGTLAEQW